MSRRVLLMAAVVLAVVAAGWGLAVMVSRWTSPASPSAEAMPPAAAAASAERRITATLYYVSEDGLSLVGVKREVAFSEAVAEQARHIIELQLAQAPEPLVSAMPAGTALRGLFITGRGDAFVDLSNDVTLKHTGGSLDELFTVYSVVNALTVNLPAIQRVQILIEGEEADTLAGHVDLRHPLQKSLKWITEDPQGRP
jgi:spore germination protein GerM